MSWARSGTATPPVPYAWMAFGSAARSEMNMASDQDNGLAYADTDDPEALEYLRVLALTVNGGLRRCGFKLDAHAVLAGNRDLAHVAERLDERVQDVHGG